MRFFSILSVAAAGFASLASAATFNVTVGKDGASAFDPTSITGAQVGDVVAFRFVSKSHSVTQSTFDKPCETKAGGVNSGFQPVAAGATVFPEWSITLSDVSAPQWFYCARAPHCSASGMVFAINPTADKTFQSFQNKARGVSSPSGTSPSGSSSSGAASSTPTSAATGIPVQKATIFLAAVGMIMGLAL